MPTPPSVDAATAITPSTTPTCPIAPSRGQATAVKTTAATTSRNAPMLSSAVWALTGRRATRAGTDGCTKGCASGCATGAADPGGGQMP
jgi:hypothetical protein